jgi:hypothetical protein
VRYFGKDGCIEWTITYIPESNEWPNRRINLDLPMQRLPFLLLRPTLLSQSLQLPGGQYGLEDKG